VTFNSARRPFQTSLHKFTSVIHKCQEQTEVAEFFLCALCCLLLKCLSMCSLCSFVAMKNETGAGREDNGTTGRGMFGRGMGNRPCRELFLCRTFFCRFFPIPLTINPQKLLMEGHLHGKQ